MGGGSETALAEWVEQQLEDVESALASRIRVALGPNDVAATLRDAPQVLLRAATARLEALVTDGCVARESAIELLTVDALVTLACEALAEAQDDVEAIAGGTTAMLRAIAQTMPQLDGAA